MAIDLGNVHKQALAIVKDTGHFINKEFKNFSEESVEIKGHSNDLVSYVDKEAERLLVEGLNPIIDDCGFIAEEGTGTKKKGGYNWIVDPLDGTTNFIHGLPVFSISLALEKEGELLLGIVYELNKDECFHAHKGGGAFLNEEKISVNKERGLGESLIATGFPYYDFDLIDRYMAILKELMFKTHGLRRLGSAAVDLAYVACGRYDSYFEYNLNAWDVAAGALIVQEAGGQVSTFSNSDDYVFGREIVASSAKVHADILKIIELYW